MLSPGGRALHIQCKRSQWDKVIDRAKYPPCYNYVKITREAGEENLSPVNLGASEISRAQKKSFLYDAGICNLAAMSHEIMPLATGATGGLFISCMNKKA